MALRSHVVEAAGVSCEVFARRAPLSFGRQLEARQRAGHRAASESKEKAMSPLRFDRCPRGATKRSVGEGQPRVNLESEA